MYYYTQLIGDARNPPILLAAEWFSGPAVIDADPYIPDGNGRQWFTNQNNFLKSVRNFVIDLRRTTSSAESTGIHWQVSQATSLLNIVFELSKADDTNHRAIYMENGSGGYMGDMIINGGKSGIAGGNQQFTVKNVVFNDVRTAFSGVWNWGWTWQGVFMKNCKVGFDLATPGIGAIAIIDAVVTNTPIFVRTSAASDGRLLGSLVLNNIRLSNVETAVGVKGGAVVLEGGTGTITSWAQGNVYAGSDSQGTFLQAPIQDAYKPSILLDARGRVFSRRQPQYEQISANDVLSARDWGAMGDGKTDDTDALQTVLYRAANNKVVFVDAGMYIITRTLDIPPGSRIVGEAWSIIAGRGPVFTDPSNAQPVVRVGRPGSRGVAEISDIIFKTVGPAGGAIVVEWNIRDPIGQKGRCGMWNSHIRLGGAAGTNLEVSQCPPGGDPYNCMAAFLALHLTPYSSAYLEGTWVWLSDHDLDEKGESKISLYSGRGILSESEGPVWMIGTGKRAFTSLLILSLIMSCGFLGSEHHIMYQYNLHKARNHYLGLIQTETPYFQPTPVAPTPFALNPKYHDPDFSDMPSAWGLWVEKSHGITIFGAGLYSFFHDYSQECIPDKWCQKHIANIDAVSDIRIFSLSTVGTEFMLDVERKGVVRQGDNKAGFAETMTFWTPGRE
ncbi:hypothetical protein HGRIS_003334 [Hohenbuehelia grisea]|uniref:Rhamnogalacturonase A/B/Epimerase-like pectate lyase domain-containing protein n=1 Tax=Hohenbuehelia grisea TaxID=104357 RepID=A0ABR3JFJ3_9AGAR